MSSEYNIVNIPSVFDTIVDSIRATGAITDIAIAAGVATVTSVNELSVGEYVVMDGTNYKILSATASLFTVAATVLAASTWKALAPYYMYGHLIEVTNTLLSKSRSPVEEDKKYPLVILVLDIEENHDSIEYYAEADVNIILAHYTTASKRASSRFDDVFIPVLYPLYQSFIEGVRVSNKLIAPMDDRVNHRKTDKLYWGRESIHGTKANKAKEFIDAIEIELLGIKFQKLINCNT